MIEWIIYFGYFGFNDWQNLDSKLPVKNILKYFDVMKHINVQHISLTNMPNQNVDYSCGVFICLYSYCASLMINKDLWKDEWCDIFFSISTTYDTHEFRSVINTFYLRLQYDENQQWINQYLHLHY